jgi:DNA-binding response OmpR family regulator
LSSPISRTALIIEDEVMVMNVVRAFLKKSGFQVIEAASGAEGVVKASAGSIDVVIADLHLRDMSGAEAVRMVRERQPRAGIVFVSGAPPQDPSILVPPAQFLGKPFDMKTLVTTVETAITAARG